MVNNYRGVEDSSAFDKAVKKLREFFTSKEFVEVHTQDRLSILAAFEDPETVATYEYAGEMWPLPQTGQTWLEYELLTKPDIAGVVCVSTSYRNEPRPVPGRHKIIFPMFEFESRGGLDDMRVLEMELVEHLGLGGRDSFPYKNYDDLAEHYGVEELSHEHENRMAKDFGKVVFLERFPQKTSPFWNMKKDGDYAHKIEVILSGAETIGSAERSSNVEEMREQFYTISEGEYADKLFSLFGKERVERELDEFLSLDFFPRYGGGIGVTRLISALA